MFLHWQSLRYTTTPRFTFSYVESGNPSSPNTHLPATVTLPTVNNGTIAYLFEVAMSFSNAIPSNPTRTGWTQITTLGQLPSGGTGVRISSYYKILSSGDSGTTITGIDPSPGDNASGGTSCLIIALCEPTSSITTISNQNIQTDIVEYAFPTFIPLPAQTLSLSSSVKPALAFAFSDDEQMNYSGSFNPVLTIDITNGHGRLFVFDLRDGEYVDDTLISIPSNASWGYAMTTFISSVA